MCVDNGYILSFQLRIHCLHSAAVYSFKTGSGDELVLYSLIHGPPLQLLPSTRLSRTQTQADHTVHINIEDENKKNPSTQKQNACNLLRAGLIRGVSSEDCCHSSSRWLWNRMTRTTASSIPAWPPTSLSIRGDFLHFTTSPHEPVSSVTSSCWATNISFGCVWTPNRCRMDEKSERVKGEIIFSMTAKTKVFFSFFFFFLRNQASEHWCKIGAFCVYQPIVSPYKSSTPTLDTWYHRPFVTHVYVWDVECCRDGMLPSPPLTSPPPPSQGCGCCLDRRHRELGGGASVRGWGSAGRGQRS